MASTLTEPPSPDHPDPTLLEAPTGWTPTGRQAGRFRLDRPRRIGQIRRVSGVAFVLHLGATLAMTGVIWLVQVVQYPLFAAVGRASFLTYHAGHTRLVTFVVMPLMLLELGSALALLVIAPAGVPRSAPWAGLALLAVVWVSTAFLQVPQHGALASGFDDGAHRALVLGNWIRTLAWTGRAALWLAVTWSLLGRAAG